MQVDQYGLHTICNIYYDTPDDLLIRRSLEHPVYKEKLRLRSYGIPGPDSPVFLEIKKKYDNIVNKRRVQMTLEEAYRYVEQGRRPEPDCQILREIDFFLQTHEVSPKAFIACEREAWVDREEPELRITFDRNLRWRDTDLHLSSGSGGEPLLPDGEVLMEIKIPGAAPLWLAHLLSELEIFPTSFSKYGTCYRQDLLEKFFNGVIVCV